MFDNGEYHLGICKDRLEDREDRDRLEDHLEDHLENLEGHCRDVQSDKRFRASLLEGHPESLRLRRAPGQSEWGSR